MCAGLVMNAVASKMARMKFFIYFGVSHLLVISQTAVLS